MNISLLIDNIYHIVVWFDFMLKKEPEFVEVGHVERVTSALSNLIIYETHIYIREEKWQLKLIVAR